MGAMPENKFILVIGANHLDILASYDTFDRKAQLDNMGSVCFALGGTAFNIACNLASDHNVSTYFLTALNPRTLGGKYAEKAIERAGIKDDFCIRDTYLDEGAFVGVYSNNSLERAVTQTTIEENRLRESIKNNIETAINDSASLVVADCNLHSSELARVLRKCYLHRKPLVVDGVSEEKSKRLIRLFYRQPSDRIDWPIEVFVCNFSEFISLLSYARSEGILSTDQSVESFERWKQNTISENTRRKICETLKVNYFVVQDPKNGYFVLCCSGKQIMRGQFEELRHNSSTLGSGDAITSGVALYIYHNVDKQNWKPDLDELDRYIRSNVTTVLRRKRSEKVMVSMTEVEEFVKSEYMKETTLSINAIRMSFFIFLIVACCFSAWLTYQETLEPTHFLIVFGTTVVCILLMTNLVTPKFLLELSDKIPFFQKT
jgi:hypothetical protein